MLYEWISYSCEDFRLIIILHLVWSLYRVSITLWAVVFSLTTDELKLFLLHFKDIIHYIPWRILPLERKRWRMTCSNQTRFCSFTTVISSGTQKLVGGRGGGCGPGHPSIHLASISDRGGCWGPSNEKTDCEKQTLGHSNQGMAFGHLQASAHHWL